MIKCVLAVERIKYLHYGEIVPLANLNDIVFGAWDVYPANAYESAVNAEVLKEKDINPVKDELEKIVPMKAALTTTMLVVWMVIM